ncbi:hypothetical protein GE09DRAFT_600054 [Coniochaeta sp. 2T2.1]|nr:hypothetical protein GE09DRAFT_600054 [Coniochaeta sp. 2T2.1]
MPPMRDSSLVPSFCSSWISACPLINDGHICPCRGSLAAPVSPLCSGFTSCLVEEENVLLLLYHVVCSSPTLCTDETFLCTWGGLKFQDQCARTSSPFPLMSDIELLWGSKLADYYSLYQAVLQAYQVMKAVRRRVRVWTLVTGGSLFAAQICLDK